MAKTIKNTGLNHGSPLLTRSRDSRKAEARSDTGVSIDPGLDRLSYILDQAIRIPGTNIRFGLDPIISLLVPAFGDSVAALMSVYIVFVSVRYGLPKGVIARMVFNIGVDYLIGSVPLIGDLFDFAWKANNKNMTLLHRHARGAGESKWSDWGWLFLLVGLHHWNYHRSATRRLLYRPLEGDSYLLLDYRVIDPLFERSGFDRLFDDATQVVEYIGGVLFVDEPTCNDLRLRFYLARCRVDGDNRQHYAVVREVLAVSNDNVFNLAVCTIDECAPDNLFICHFGRILVQRQHVAVLDDQNTSRPDYTERLGPFLMPVKLAILAVDRDQKPGPRRFDQYLQIILAAVTRTMNPRKRAIDDPRPSLVAM
jgi:hypothetical protein